VQVSITGRRYSSADTISPCSSGNPAVEFVPKLEKKGAVPCRQQPGMLCDSMMLLLLLLPLLQILPAMSINCWQSIKRNASITVLAVQAACMTSVANTCRSPSTTQ
jgi:hypothetical protein